jgi:hypothetical protein
VLGYSQWQVTDDEGADARNLDVHDQVHAIGGQLGYAIPKRSSKTLNPFDNIWGGTQKGASIFLSVRRFKHSLPDADFGVFQAPGENALYSLAKTPHGERLHQKRIEL